MTLNEKSKKLIEIECLIDEAKEDRERALKSTQNSKNKESSDTAFNFYSATGQTIEQMIEEHNDIIADIVSEINTLDNPNQRRILKKKYLDRKSIKTISVEMNYSYGYVLEMISKSEDELKKTYTI